MCGLEFFFFLIFRIKILIKIGVYHINCAGVVTVAGFAAGAR